MSCCAACSKSPGKPCSSTATTTLVPPGYRGEAAQPDPSIPGLYAAGFRPSVGVCPGDHYRHPDGRHYRRDPSGIWYLHTDRYPTASLGHLGEAAAVLFILPGFP